VKSADCVRSSRARFRNRVESALRCPDRSAPSRSKSNTLARGLQVPPSGSGSVLLIDQPVSDRLVGYVPSQEPSDQFAHPFGRFLLSLMVERPTD
jgi:hypothetical protein